MLEIDEVTQPPLGTNLPERVVRLFSSDAGWDHGITTWPESGDTFQNLLARSSKSKVPEDAMLLLACGLPPQFGVDWVMRCVKAVNFQLTEAEQEILELVDDWILAQDGQTQQRLLVESLWKPERSAAVLLGLAVGFQSKLLAPQWSMPVPEHFSAICLNEAVATCLAMTEPYQRDITIQKFISLALPLLDKLDAAS